MINKIRVQFVVCKCDISTIDYYRIIFDQQNESAVCSLQFVNFTSQIETPMEIFMINKIRLQFVNVTSQLQTTVELFLINKMKVQFVVCSL